MKRSVVSCIVVTYNSEGYIDDCLAALEKSVDNNVEIVVVDNGSTDATISLVKNHTKVQLYRNSHNNGYAGGHTVGMLMAKGMYFFLLNPDTTVSPGFLKPLVSKMESDEKIGACQPLVYLSHEKKKVNLTGKVTQYAGFDWIRDFRETRVRQSGPIISCSGSGVLLRASALKEIGGFDTSYFMYYEDTDISWRLRLFGYTLWYCADSVIFHDYKLMPDEKYQSIQQKLFWAERNRLATLYKNYSLKTILLLIPMILFLETSLLVYFTIRGWLGVKVRSYVSLWRSRKQLNKERKSVQASRRVCDADITKEFVSKIDFILFDNPIVAYIINPLLSFYWRILCRFI